MINIDLHTHICRTEFKDMIEGAVEKKIKIYGISGHIYQFAEVRRIFPDFYLEGTVYTLEQYRRLFSDNRPAFRLLCGTEIDFLPGFTQRAMEELKKIDFDYIIGSLHEIEGWDIHHARQFSDEEAREMWKRNVDIQMEWMRQGWCNILGHPIRMAVSVRWSLKEMEGLLRQLAACAREMNVAIELNARDYTTDRRLFELLLHACKQENALVAAGSDAHFPQDIAKNFEQIEDCMKAAGIFEYCIYMDKKVEKRRILKEEM